MAENASNRFGLLRGEESPDGLQLVLHHLELVDRFLLGRFQALGLLDQLLGGLRGTGLQLAEHWQDVGEDFGAGGQQHVTANRHEHLSP